MMLMDVFILCDFMRGSIFQYMQCLWLLDGKGRTNITTMMFNTYWAKNNKHIVYPLGEIKA